MQVRTYGLFDSCAKEIVRTFTSRNDEVAERAIQYIVRDPNFDRIAGRDFVVQYLYTMDTETGYIVDNTIKTIASMASAIDAYEMELKGNLKDEKQNNSN